MLGWNCRKLWDVGGDNDTYQRGLNALAKPQKASGAKGGSWRISDRTVRQAVGSFGGCQGRNTRKEYVSMGISGLLGIWEQVRRRHIGVKTEQTRIARD